jgi:solute:Na+ symporter, SSS family
VLFVLSSVLVFFMETAQDSFNIILQIGAGTGLLYLLRWFWWRVNAWCEVVAMASSFAISLLFLVLARTGTRFDTHKQLLLTVIFTTVCWLATAYLGPETDHRTLVEFYRKVRPFGPGWRRIRLEAGVSEEEAALYARHENIPLSLLGWVAGCVAIWSSLFAVGNWLYGRTGYGVALTAVFVLSSLLLVRVIRRLWK